ncbi:MAG: adenylate/guanylate cyclase domain-containing protein [Spirochaetota bacterium]|nr:adenylate/guanylate cyclase domain-containing protein [Spirochaetota bacterium]
MKKKYILFFYGLILVAINLLAIFFTNSFVSYVSDTELFNLMKEYLSNNNILRIITMIIPFVVPCALCTVYAKNHNWNDVQQEKKLLVNTPLVFSLIGISGWTTGLAINIINIFYLRFKTNLYVLSIILDYTFPHIFLMIFTFMGTFFILETINRKYVLPRFIPDGHISEIKGVINPSITLIYILLYITICLFPCFILSSTLIRNLNITLPVQNLANIIILMGIVFTLNLLLTIVISRFYSKPLLRLKDCAQNIANGNYDIRTGITTGDELGVLSDTFNDMAVSLQEKELMYETFGKVVTPEIRNWLLQGNTKLGGETVCATILFCDIRGFTSLSEQIKPEQVVKLLNKYFFAMEQCIVKHNGIINKYIGDAIMAIFGVPVPNEKQAIDAYKCCLDMRKTLTELNKELENENLPPIKFGIGLHTGNVLAGNIGSNSRMEYTVIGDAVNVASRIESLCKEYNCDLLISETTAEGIIADESFSSQLKSIGETQIRGRKTAISIYKG